MKNFKHLALWGFASMLLCSGCQDENFGYSSEEIAYRSNFEKTFGEIDPDQIWDFSSYNLDRLGLAGGPSSEGTRAGIKAYTGKQPEATEGAASAIATALSGYYEIEKSTETWLDQNLTEGVDHRSLGAPFTLMPPNSNNFLLIPIYQGHAGMTWDLHIVAKDPADHVLKDYCIWHKSEGLVYDVNYNDWPEYYYSSDADGDISWTNDRNDGTLSLAKGYPSIAQATDGDAKIRFVVPKGEKVAGSFQCGSSTLTFKVGDETKTSFEVNNQGTEDQTYEITLGTVQSDGTVVDFTAEEGQTIDFSSLVFAFNGVTKIDGNSVLSSYEDYRVRIYTYYVHVQKDIPTTLDFQTGHTMDRAAVRGLGFEIDKSKIEDEFFFYLHVTKGVDNWANAGTAQRSDEGMMLALTGQNIDANIKEKVNALLPDGKKLKPEENPEYMIIGCEDANLSGSDHDINDVCFLLIGLPVAPSIGEVIRKRYMIEDLGSTFDYDFNDIVIDVEQRRMKNVAGQYINTNSDGSFPTKATLKHLSGTIPFQVKIGNTILGVWEGNTEGKYMGNNGDCERGGDGFDPSSDSYYANMMNYDVFGWDPDLNNIYVKTWPSQAGAAYDSDGKTNSLGRLDEEEESFSFPNKGEFPYMIACDPDIDWMKEMVTVPSTWFKTWPQSYHDYADEHGTGTDDRPTDTSVTLHLDVDYSYEVKAWEQTHKLLPSEFTSIEVGNQLIVTIKDIQSGAQLALQEMAGGWLPIDDKTYYLTSDQTTIAVTITEDIKSRLQANGVAIKGQGFTIVKATISTEAPAPDGKTIEMELDKEYDFVVSSWDHNAKLPAAQFTAIEVGDQLVVTIKDVTGNAQMQLQDMDSWTAIDGNHNLSAGQTSVSVTITEDIKAKLQAYGVAIKGVGFTVVKSSIVKAEYFTLTLSVDGLGGTVSASPQQEKYLKGSQVKVTATPDEGYKFASWSDGGNRVHTITVNANTTLTATFEEGQQEEDPIATLFEGEFNTEGSGNCKKIIDWSDPIAEGKTIKVYYTGPWLNVYVTYWGSTVTTQDGQGYKYFVLTADQVANIKNNGLRVQGENTIVTKVTVE